MTGNSRRQLGHHSAQNTMYTGLDPSERVYSPPSPNTSVKSGATGLPESVVGGDSGSEVVGVEWSSAVVDGESATDEAGATAS